MSMAIKLMGVPGPKLMDDEKFTQDLFGTSAPTFVSPDTRANAELQHWSLKNAQVFYFFNPRDSHMLDSLMQLLWTKTQTSPLEDQYFSCVPYLLGEGQAMQYHVQVAASDARHRCRDCRFGRRTTICGMPWRPRWPRQDVEFDIFVQVQTDPFLMPIENAAVMWPTSVSPRVPVAVLRIPQADVRFAAADGVCAGADL